ncbi:MAG: prenyltransferase [Acidilobaceae archaeon]
MIREKLRVYWSFLRPQTSLSTVLAGLGGAIFACRESECLVFESLLAVLGVSIAHLSVNAINDIQDHLSGLDRETSRTPYSGGTKLLVESKLSLAEAILLAIATFVIAASIGLYFSLLYGLTIFLFVVIGALIIILYDPYLLRVGLGELGVFAKGVLVFLGCAYIASRELYLPAIPIGAIYGLLSVASLYVNQIPDAEADAKYGRRTLPVILGDRVWVGYAAILVFLAVSLASSIILKLLSPLILVPVSLIAFYALRVLMSLTRERRNISSKTLRDNSLFCRLFLVSLTLLIAVNPAGY